MSIQVVTFDLDNTLWDVEPALQRAEAAQREWLMQHRPGSIEDIDHDAMWELKQSLWQRHPELAHHISRFREQLLYELQRSAGYGEREAREGAREAFAVFLEQRHDVELYEEALSVIQTLSADYRIGALTNGNADIYKTDAGDYFDFAFLAEEVGASKPAPDMFHAAIKRCGVPAPQVAHVGDSMEHDVLGARGVGMRAIWFNPSREAWQGDAADAADAQIDRLQQLPGILRNL